MAFRIFVANLARDWVGASQPPISGEIGYESMWHIEKPVVHPNVCRRVLSERQFLRKNKSSTQQGGGLQK